MTEQLSGPLKMMQDSARRIARVSVEAKLNLDEEGYVESFRPHLMDVVHAWSTVSPKYLLWGGRERKSKAGGIKVIAKYS